MKKNIIKELGVTAVQLETLWREWALGWNNWNGEFIKIWFGYKELSKETGIPIRTLAKIMKVLRENGIAHHATCCGKDYTPYGSGNFLNNEYVGKTWDEIKKLLDNQK